MKLIQHSHGIKNYAFRQKLIASNPENRAVCAGIRMDGGKVITATVDCGIGEKPDEKMNRRYSLELTEDETEKLIASLTEKLRDMRAKRGFICQDCGGSIAISAEEKAEGTYTPICTECMRGKPLDAIPMERRF